MEKSKLFKLSVVTVAAVGITGAVGYFGLQQVAAEVANGNYPTIIQNLAKKFNLKETDVQAVFDDTKSQAQSARLDQAVKNGTITEAQKTLIINKQKEVQTQIEAINNKQLTQSERQNELQKIHTNLETWATDNKIALRLIGPMGMGGRGGEFGGKMMRGQGSDVLEN